MALYQAAFSVAGVNTANSCLVNLKTASTDRARLVEVGISISTAPTAAPDIVLTRMNQVGTGTITSAGGQPAEIAETAGTAVMETGWTTARPTMLTTYHRRFILPLTIGAGIIWSWERGIAIPVSSGLCLGNVVASGATVGQFTGYMMWDE